MPKTLGLNRGDEASSSGDGQPQKNAPESEPEVNVDELNSEVDQHLKNAGDPDDDLEAEDQGDDTVVLPKAKFERLKKNHDNYRSGLLSVKDKFKNLKRGRPAEATPQSDKPEQKPDDANKGKPNPIETTAIAQLTEAKLPTGRDNPDYNKDVDEHWAEILPYYTPRHGTATPADIVKDILDAYTLFRRDNPKDDTEESRETTANLGSESGKPTGDKSQGGKPTERKHVLPRTTSAQSWYPTKK